MGTFRTPTLRTEFQENFRAFGRSVEAHSRLETIGSLVVDPMLVSRRLYFLWQNRPGFSWVTEAWEYEGNIVGYNNNEPRFTFPIGYEMVDSSVSLGPIVNTWTAATPAKSIGLARGPCQSWIMPAVANGYQMPCSIPNSVYVSPGCGDGYNKASVANNVEYFMISPFTFAAEINLLRIELSIYHSNVAAPVAVADWTGMFYFACFSQHPMPLG